MKRNYLGDIYYWREKKPQVLRGGGRANQLGTDLCVYWNEYDITITS